ncbi:NADH:flavin oxidoreductase/NADH oxidase family protein [Acinetobacter larvae]|uniref:2,4-dienoyl-CoA reductase n=1 Tax=Acinetobacter larvae TaxID=1789224 RepID=A0A1B2M4E9_9GAMM|nr:NADH:flavin oxidoreductase/NADH oxidase family protein [Acinetobacter larvae]AOA59933.1 2,4-dienoyl-CoA reductase [Acinetobacter larvae]
MTLFAPLLLSNGRRIQNRIAKAAMEENMADHNHAPSDALLRLYQAWAAGGVGLIITGNVMVDRRAMTGPAGVVLENEQHLSAFRKWADVSRAHGAQVWMQINHPGRQMQANLGQQTWAPSAVAMNLGNMSKRFNRPIAMTEAMITELIQRFSRTAQLAEQAGFDGVEVHAAHGYLLSQFLSPLTNQRQDRWGGSLENRARLLLEIIRAIRAVVSKNFAVAVKLNSADFQRGGFSPAEAQQVVSMLNAEAVDLVEISGGSYEAPAMQGKTRDERSLAREAYFLEFATEIVNVAHMPVMLTGGIRRKAVAEQVLSDGIAMVGIATALALMPDLVTLWQHDDPVAAQLPPIQWSNKTLAALVEMARVKYQLQRHSRGLAAKPNVAPWWALLKEQQMLACRSRLYRKQMQRVALT